MNKKEHIINIASKLFSERGFECTPLSSICELADVSKGLIFHYFKSKNDLLREIFKRTTDLIVEMNNPEFEIDDPKQTLIGLLNSFFQQLEADKMFFQLNIGMMLQPNTREILDDLIKERSSFILSSVRNIFNGIDSENSEVMSFILIAELDGIALNYLGIFEEYPLELIKEHIINKYR